MLLPDPIPHTVEAIYQAIAAKARGSDSRGVPMSDAANECNRATWYKLRWAATRELIDGQKQSRFDTGLLWENRLLDALEAAGIQVGRTDPATGKQFRLDLAGGWLRGKMDGCVTGLPEAPKTVHVVEVKSHSEKSFKELLKHTPPKGEGLRKSKPDHYAQCQLYCHARGLSRALYLAVNKNDDALYAERIEYDAAFALALEAKITRIAQSDRAPPRLYDDPKSKAAFACQWCPALTLCHEGAFARRNCRTCLHSQFEDGAEVRCTKLDKLLTYEEQQVGCGQHLYLPDLVPGEQIDSGDTWVAYDLNGKSWIDGVVPEIER